MTAASDGGGQRRPSQSPNQERAHPSSDPLITSQRWNFVAACRRQWPAAIIVLRPAGAPTGSSAPTHQKPAPGVKIDN
jgi:hypothetical protein